LGRSVVGRRLRSPQGAGTGRRGRHLHRPAVPFGAPVRRGQVGHAALLAAGPRHLGHRRPGGLGGQRSIGDLIDVLGALGPEPGRQEAAASGPSHPCGAGGEGPLVSEQFLVGDPGFGREQRRAPRARRPRRVGQGLAGRSCAGRSTGCRTGWRRGGARAGDTGTAGRSVRPLPGGQARIRAARGCLGRVRRRGGRRDGGDRPGHQVVRPAGCDAPTGQVALAGLGRVEVELPGAALDIGAVGLVERPEGHLVGGQHTGLEQLVVGLPVRVLLAPARTGDPAGGALLTWITGDDRRHLPGRGLGPVGELGGGATGYGRLSRADRVDGVAVPRRGPGLVGQAHRGLLEPPVDQGEGLEGRRNGFGEVGVATRVGRLDRVGRRSHLPAHQGQLGGGLTGGLGADDADLAGARPGGLGPRRLQVGPRHLVVWPVRNIVHVGSSLPSAGRTPARRAVRSRGAPAPCGPEGGRWRPPAPG